MPLSGIAMHKEPVTLLNDSVSLLLITFSRAGRPNGLQGKGARLPEEVPVGSGGPYHQPRQQQQQQPQPHGRRVRPTNTRTACSHYRSGGQRIGAS